MSQEVLNNTVEQPKMQSRNATSGVEFLKDHGDVNFFPAKQEGKFFFSCGSVRGYASNRVIEALKSNSLKPQDIQFAECSTDGNTWMWCCMMLTNKNSIGKLSLR